MPRFVILVAVALVVGSAGCHSASSSGAIASTAEATEPPKNGRFVTDAQNRKICELPLSVYCADKPCEPYSAAVVTARALVSRNEIWGTAEIGTCGSLELVHRGAWYMHEYEYFDGEKMVGAEVSVDNLGQFCDGKSGFARYGNVPTCKATPTEIILDGSIP